MFIKKIILENDKRIFAGLGLNKIEIDFNKKNDLNLILGDNGTGKTSLESSLSPFACEVIRDGFKGRKKIIYKKKNSEIEIEHIYVPKKDSGHTSKHYIRKIKNGYKEELNENGNLSSFLEAVEEELDITQLQMELIQLGVDMKSIIEKQPSERKKYVSKFIDDIQIYLKKYDNVNEKLKTIDSLLKNYSSSLSKLGDKEKIKDVLFDIKRINLDLENTKEKLIKDIGILNNNIEEKNKYLKENKETYDKYIKYQELDEELKNKSYNDLLLEIKDIEKEILILDKEKSLLDLKEQNITEEITRKNEELNNYTNQLNLISYNSMDEDYKEKLIKTKDEIGKLSAIVPENYQELYENKNAIRMIIQSVIDYNNNIDNILSGVDDGFKFNMSDSKSLENNLIEYKKELSELEKSIIDLAVKLQMKQKEIDTNSKIPDNCFSLNCPFIINKKSKDELEKELYELRNDIGILQAKERGINNNINNLEISLKIRILIDNLNKNINNNSYIINLIRPYFKNGYVPFKDFIDNNYKKNNIDIDKINNVLNSVEIYVSDINLVESIEKEEKENKEYINIENKISILKTDLKTIEEYKLSFENESLMIDNKIKDNNDKIDRLKNYTNTLDEFKNIDEISKIGEEYIKYKNSYDDDLQQYKSLNNDLQICNENLDFNNKKKEELQSKLKQIKTIEKSKNVLDSYYLDCKMVRDSLSTNKGIPTIKIDSYMQQIRFRANEILQDCFEDEIFQFDSFVINSKEFRLPIINSGDGVEDISKCSAGQKALGMLAISLAIFEKTGSKYNIISLDEVDGQLDDTKRRNFLKIVKDKTEELGIQQIFLISHNKAFNDVDSNYILFKGADIDSINNQKNIIFKI